MNKDATLHSHQMGGQAERFLSMREICRLTGASRATIWRWQQNAEIPASVKIGHRKAAIPESDYLAWAKERMSIRLAG